MLKPIRWLRNWSDRGRQTFYDGPALYDYPGRRIRGYRSPNVMLAQWLHAFLASRFTLAGRMLFMFGIAVFLAGMTALEMPIYLLAFALLSLFLVDFVVGWLLKPKVSIVRRLPRSAPADSPITVTYQVQNHRHRLPAWDVYVDTIPMPSPIAFIDGIAQIPRLAPGETVSITNLITVPRRGRYFLPMPVADSAFPFGVWRWGSRGPSTGPLLIYPNYRSLSHVEVPQGAPHAAGEAVVAALAGDSMEFVGCREYRYGDNLRHIHAPSWARLRTPIVKEFRDESHNRVSIILDTCMPPPPVWTRFSRAPLPQFEAAMSVTAALTEYLVRQQYQVDLTCIGDDAASVEPGGGPDQHIAVMETLAALQPDHRGAFHLPGPEQMAEIHTANCAFVILLAWDAERQAAVHELARAGLGLRLILVSPRLRTLPGGAHMPLQLQPAHILDGQITEL